MERPAVVSLYFDQSNVIDSHNHYRQHILGLERHWKTINPWFRNDCTWIGMTVVDCYRSVQYKVKSFNEGWTLSDFVGALSWDCINNPYQKTSVENRMYLEPTSGDPHESHRIFAQGLVDQASQTLERQMESLTNQFLLNLSVSRTQRISDASTLTSDTGLVYIGEHDVAPIPKQDNDGRPVKRRCVICKKNTRWMCSNDVCKLHESTHKSTTYHGIWVCNPSTGARKELEGNQDNSLTCLQIHRDQVRQKREAEIKLRMNARGIMN